MVPRWRVPLLLAVLLLGLFPASALAAERELHPYVQVLLGAASFNRDALRFPSAAAAGSGSSDTVDLRQMPYLGLAFQLPLAGRRTEIGFDAAILGGWRSRATSVLISNNQVRLRIKADFWLLDLSGGIFLRHPLGEQWVGYLAAGPAMLFGGYRRTSKAAAGSGPLPPRESEEAFGLGGYARAGLAYRLPAAGFIGFCLRGLATDLRFPDAPSAAGLSGIQGFITFSRRF